MKKPHEEDDANGERIDWLGFAILLLIIEVPLVIWGAWKLIEWSLT